MRVDLTKQSLNIVSMHVSTYFHIYVWFREGMYSHISHVVHSCCFLTCSEVLGGCNARKVKCIPPKHRPVKE